MRLTHQQVTQAAGGTTLRLQADPSWTVGLLSDLVRECAEMHWGKGCVYTYTRGSDHDGIDIELTARNPELEAYLANPAMDPPWYNTGEHGIQKSCFTHAEFDVVCKLIGGLVIRDLPQSSDELEWLHHQACEVYGPTDELRGNLAYMAIEHWVNALLERAGY